MNDLGQALAEYIGRQVVILIVIVASLFTGIGFLIGKFL